MTNAPKVTTPPDLDSLWDYDHPAETEKKFRTILPEADRWGGIGYKVELLTQIARTLGLQQRFDEAHALLDTVEPLLPKAGETASVRYLLERGRCYNSGQQIDRAIPLFREAWERADKAGLDFYSVDAAHMMAIAMPAAEKSLWNDRAVATAETSSDPKARRWLGSLYNNIGWSLFEEKKYDSALVMFRRAFDFRFTQGKPDQIRFAKWCVAKGLRFTNQVDAALSTQEELQRDIESSGAEPDGFVFEELAECHLTLGHKEKSREYFARAYTLLSQDPWLARDEPERLARMRELSGSQ
jgi:tetratricopeptide (TPR) repeat protein